MGLLDFLKNKGLVDSAASLTLDDGSRWEVLVDPEKVERTVEDSASLVVVHTSEGAAKMHFDVCQRASLRIIELFAGDSFVECDIHQQADSVCDVTCVSVAGSVADYTIDLDGQQAANRVRAAYIAGGDERTKVSLRVNHNTSDCTSDSLVKGVAGGKAVGEFYGLVYVAQDAQRTDARQTNRNIEIGSEAKIITKPQLEIYADDVKCSHGATVGQLDEKALFYMQQRGISLKEARLLLMFAFVNEVIDTIRMDALKDRLHLLVEKRFRGELNKCQGCAIFK